MSLFLKTNDFPKGNKDEIPSDFFIKYQVKKAEDLFTLEREYF